jgi:TatD family hydrolase
VFFLTFSPTLLVIKMTYCSTSTSTFTINQTRMRIIERRLRRLKTIRSKSRKSTQCAIVPKSFDSRNKKNEEEDEEENERFLSCETPKSESFAFVGTERLYGRNGAEKLKKAKVLIVGIGGVGSWVAEALARTNVGKIILIDLDFVCETNMNRQVMATRGNIGRSKVRAMQERLLEINKDLCCECVEDFVSERNVGDVLGPLLIASRDDCTVVDCTDNEADKAAIIAFCTKLNVPVMTTGGCAGMTNFPNVVIEDLQKATFNRLLASTRKKLREKYFFPRGVKKFPNGAKMKSEKGEESFRERKFKVTAVYAKESNENFIVRNNLDASKENIKGGGKINCADGSSGSAAFVTGAIGLAAASQVVVDILSRTDAQREKIGKPFESGWQSQIPAWKNATATAETNEGTNVPSSSNNEHDSIEGAKNNSNNNTKESSSIVQMNEDEEALSDFIGVEILKQASKDELKLSEVFDAHCHWHLNSNRDAIENLGKEVYKFALTCTQPTDWQKAIDISKAFDYNVPVALGSHPWWIHENKAHFETWIEELERVVSETPNCIIGEIGLDKIAIPLDGTTEADYAFQVVAFQRQLELARKMNKPIAVHCVKATQDIQNALFDSQTSSTTIPVLMHSYSGSTEWMRQLVTMKQNKGKDVYFGFSSVVNLRGWKKTVENIKKCPDDRIVIESDLVSCENVENELRKIIAMVAKCKNWSVIETARITRVNADRLYGFRID